MNTIIGPASATATEGRRRPARPVAARAAAEPAGGAGAARRAAGQQQGLRAGLRVPGARAIRRPDPWPHLPRHPAPGRGGPARRRRHPAPGVRAFRRAGRGRRPRLPGAAPLGHDRHHQCRRVRPPRLRLLAPPPARGRGRGGGEPRLRRRAGARTARSSSKPPSSACSTWPRTAAPRAASSPSSGPWPMRCWPPSAPSRRRAASPACPRACATSTPRPAACTAPTC